MAATATPATNIAILKPCISASRNTSKPSLLNFVSDFKGESWTKLRSSSHNSSLNENSCSRPLKFKRFVTKAVSETSNPEPLWGLPIDLRGWKFYVDLFHSLFFSVILF